MGSDSGGKTHPRGFTNENTSGNIKDRGRNRRTGKEVKEGGFSHNRCTKKLKHAKTEKKMNKAIQHLGF